MQARPPDLPLVAETDTLHGQRASLSWDLYMRPTVIWILRVGCSQDDAVATAWVSQRTLCVRVVRNAADGTQCSAPPVATGAALQNIPAAANEAGPSTSARAALPDWDPVKELQNTQCALACI